MVILRATKKVLKLLPQEGPVDDLASDTALGDWYVNRLVVDRQPLLLLISANSRFAIIERAREVRNLPAHLGAIVRERLERLSVPPPLIEAEARAMEEVRVGPTADRSLTGQLVDFAKAIKITLPINGWDDQTLRRTERLLWDTPCLCGRRATTIFPDQDTIELLTTRWTGNQTRH